MFKFLGDYKDAKELYNNEKNYMEAIGYLQSGNSKKARELLSVVDNDYRDTSTIISQIDLYSKYVNGWRCFWAEGVSAGGSRYSDDDDDYFDSHKHSKHSKHKHSDSYYSDPFFI